jgi:hypothetical protein
MSATTRVNGGGSTHGTLFSVVQLKAFVIDAGATLASSGGVNGALEALIQEVQPLMYQSVSTSGVVHVIVDGHAVDAASLQARIIAIGNRSTGSGDAFTYDFTGATVALGTNIVVS